jgi:FMN phosphatase YigB (HAD superfamily)
MPTSAARSSIVTLRKPWAKKSRRAAARIRSLAGFSLDGSTGIVGSTAARDRFAIFSPKKLISYYQFPPCQTRQSCEIASRAANEIDIEKCSGLLTLRGLLMIRAIVFDLGGVVFSEGKGAAVQHLVRIHGYNPDFVSQILSSPKSIELRKGLISDEEFWSWAQSELPRGYDTLLIKKAWYDGYVLDDDIYKLIEKLKGKYKIVAFSGNIKSRVDFLEQRYRFRRLFDQEIYSFDYHLTKPDRKFVEVMVAEVGCRPEEIVYIEDNDQYTVDAREMKLNVLIYCRGEIKVLVRKLRQLGVVW